jgi:hypothetical protein
MFPLFHKVIKLKTGWQQFINNTVIICGTECLRSHFLFGQIGLVQLF